MSVAICIPSREHVNIGFAKCLANLTARLTAQGIEYEVIISLGSVIPQLRNTLAKTALRNGHEWVMWLDSDMHFPNDCVEQLMSHNKAIVAATYSTRYKPQRSVAFVDKDDVESRAASGEGLQTVFAVGMGCMLVHTSVFQTLPQPWFMHEWNTDEETFSGEDVYFCNLANNNNINVYVDLDISKELAHYGTKAFLLQETQDFI